MFGKLKEKLKSWTKKISDEQEEKIEVVEDVVNEKENEVDKKVEHKIENVDNIETLKEVVEKGANKIKDNLSNKKVNEDISKEIVDKKEIEEKQGTKSFFEKVTSKINKIKISEKEFDIYAEELEMLLLENNVAIEVAEKIISELKNEIIGKELLKKEIAEEIKDIFKEIIENILIEPYDLVDKINENVDEPYVVLFCGVNGTGKTTSIAKVADYLKRNKLSCVIAAADTFRAASIEQIKTHGEKLGVNVVAHDYGSDPASVGFDAIAYAKKNNINCVLIDTAGRMHTAKNLLKEMEKIVKVCSPNLKIFVGESITGNDILEQVRSFDWAIGIDGVILTKADIDEKGGTALSVGYVTKKPILYLGTGQEYEKMEPFDREKFIERLGL